MTDWEIKKGLLKQYDFRCAYCGFDFLASPSHFGAMTWDHLRSVRDGGTDEGNLVPACFFCNTVLKGKSSFNTVVECKEELARRREAFLNTWEYYDMRKAYRSKENKA